MASASSNSATAPHVQKQIALDLFRQRVNVEVLWVVRLCVFHRRQAVPLDRIRPTEQNSRQLENMVYCNSFSKSKPLATGTPSKDITFLFSHFD